MNRYPLWKYLVIAVALVIGSLYALPNLFGESPAVQVSAGKSTVRIDTETVVRVEAALAAANLKPSLVQFDGNSIKARFDTTDEQLQARDALERAFNTEPGNPSHVVALNLLPRTPVWLSSLGASPMYLGLDLRGGVHFMLQVDMNAALQRRMDVLLGDVRTALRENTVRHNGLSRQGATLTLSVRDEATEAAATQLLKDQFPDLLVSPATDPAARVLTITLNPVAARAVQDQALQVLVRSQLQGGFYVLFTFI